MVNNDKDKKYKKILILDLDHTIIASIKNTSDKMIEGGNFVISFDEKHYTVFKRNYLDIFLNFCEKNFEHIIIWSMGVQKYVDLIVDKVFEYRQKKPILVLGREKCDHILGKRNDKWKNTSLLKYHLNLLNVDYIDHKFVFIDDCIDRIRVAEHLDMDIIEIDEFVTIDEEEDYHVQKSKNKRKRSVDLELMKIVKRLKK